MEVLAQIETRGKRVEETNKKILWGREIFIH